MSATVPRQASRATPAQSDAAAGSPARPDADLLAIADRRFERSVRVTAAFFDANADRISRACLDMARRFERGGRLLAFGSGAEATDAAHVSVEFVHPVLVGKRALPALALTSDAAVLTGDAGADPAGSFARALLAIGRPADIALGLAHAAPGPAVLAALAAARERGMLTIVLAGGDDAFDSVSDHVFTVPSDDAFAVQEVHETLYHVFWELVHVFFETGAARI